MKTEELRKIVETLKPAFKLNDIAEFGKYIIFANNKVFVYNGITSIVMKYDNDVEFAVPANEFSKFINKVKLKEIEINIDKSIVIKAGNAKAEFALNNDIVEKSKNLNINIPDDFKALPSDFIDALKLCQYSVGKDKSFESFTYINVCNHAMASTDNFRVSEYIMNESIENEIMIPGDSAKYLISFNIDSYAIHDGCIFFKNKDDVFFITRTGALSFPDYADYIDSDGEEIELPEDIIDMIETASVTADGIVDSDKNIVIEIKNKKISVTAENEIGKIVVDGEISYNDEAKIAINPLFLLQILKISRKIILCDNRILFNIGNFRHVVALFSN